MSDLITMKDAMTLIGVKHHNTFKATIARYRISMHPFGTGSRVRYSRSEIIKKLNIKAA